MNPRDIRVCVESISRLPTDKAWLTAFTEQELNPVISTIVENTDYTHYFILSDDGIHTVNAWNHLIDTLDDGHPVATGYVNLTAEDMRVNITKTPFKDPDWSTADDYDFWHLSEVMAWDTDTKQTYFAGYGPTGMTRDMWLEFPYAYRIFKHVSGVHKSVPSDWWLSRRLTDASVPIVAHKAAFNWHVKETLAGEDVDPAKGWLIGKVAPQVSWEWKT